MKKTFSKGDKTDWSSKLDKSTEIINDTIPSYEINKLPVRHNKAILKKTELS